MSCALNDMTVEDWRRRVDDMRSMLLEAERQLARAEQKRLDESPLVQAVIKASRRPVRGY